MRRQGVALILASRRLLPGKSLPRDIVLEILKVRTQCVVC